MFNIGPMELLVIMGIALVVLGPEKFPEVTKIVMRTIRDVRAYWNDAKRDLADELRPVQKEMHQLTKYNPEEYVETLARSVTDAVSDETKPDAHESTPSAGATSEKGGGVPYQSEGNSSPNGEAPSESKPEDINTD